MDRHQNNLERGAESAFATAAAGMLVVSLGSNLSRRRRAQGRSPRAAKATCLVLWLLLVIYWTVTAWDGGVFVVGTMAVLSVPVAVIAAYVLLWMLSLVDRATGRLAKNRPGHWVTVEECAQQRAQCESLLRQAQANVPLDGLLAAGTGLGGLLGGDIGSVMIIRDRLQALNQIEAHLRAGGTYWTWDD